MNVKVVKEFARRMGIQRQNVNVLFKARNIDTIARAADVLGVPFGLLVGYVDEPNLSEFPLEEPREIMPEDVPTGDTTEDRRMRHYLIRQFYGQWMS